MLRSVTKILREPLLGFLLLGLGIFLLFELVGEGNRERPDRIVVRAAQVQRLAEGFRRTWQRPPTEAELEGLIAEHIREEILYREAIALGLDRDDTIIRRRLRQKMEFLSEDPADRVEPSDDELRAFLDRNAEEFRVRARLSFVHVYLSADRRGDAVRRDSDLLLAELAARNGRVDPAALGDPLLLPREFEAVDEDEVARLFGPEFAGRLLGLEPGRWAGPVESGYGLHLVLVRERSPGYAPELAEVRDGVEREWLAAHRQEAGEAVYRRFRERYEIVVKRAEEEPASARAEASR
jgi:hypothetical protein